jgi:hypothetical protein
MAPSAIARSPYVIDAWSQLPPGAVEPMKAQSARGHNNPLNPN